MRDSLGRVVSIEAIHLMQYALLGGLTAWVSAGATFQRRLRWAAFIVAVGLLDELAQELMPGRSFEWSDVGLNLLGGGLGMLAGMRCLPRRGSAHDLF